MNDIFSNNVEIERNWEFPCLVLGSLGIFTMVKKVIILMPLTIILFCGDFDDWTHYVIGQRGCNNMSQSLSSLHFDLSHNIIM